MARDDAACPTCSRLTYSIKEYAVALGISERSARYSLRAGDLDAGVVRVGGRVLVLRQFVRDMIDRALGLDPDPEELADAAAEADERERQLAVVAKADAKGRERYAAMTKARSDGPTEELVFK